MIFRGDFHLLFRIFPNDRKKAIFFLDNHHASELSGEGVLGVVRTFLLFFKKKGLFFIFLRKSVNDS